MKRLAVFALLLATPAVADEVSPVATYPAPPTMNVTPAAPTPVTHWTLDLDQSDMQTLNQAVMELPKRIADPFIVKMQAHLKPAEGK